MSIEQLLGGLLSAAVGGIGYILGQFAPFTGVAQLAEPFSPIRDQTAFSYAVVGALIGTIAGLSVKAHGPHKHICAACGAKSQSDNSDEHREGPVQ